MTMIRFYSLRLTPDTTHLRDNNNIRMTPRVSFYDSVLVTSHSFRHSSSLKFLRYLRYPQGLSHMCLQVLFFCTKWYLPLASSPAPLCCVWCLLWLLLPKALMVLPKMVMPPVIAMPTKGTTAPSSAGELRPSKRHQRGLLMRLLSLDWGWSLWLLGPSGPSGPLPFSYSNPRTALCHWDSKTVQIWVLAALSRYPENSSSGFYSIFFKSFSQRQRHEFTGAEY